MNVRYHQSVIWGSQLVRKAAARCVRCKKSMDASLALPPGVRPNVPVSTSSPNEREVASTDRLVKYLDEHAPLESREETARREIVLSQLTQLIREWVREQCQLKRLPRVRTSHSAVPAACPHLHVRLAGRV